MSHQAAQYRYTPGDGYIYTWDGGPWVTIYRVTTDATGTRREVLTPDVIKAPDARTAAALMAAVDSYRTRT